MSEYYTVYDALVTLLVGGVLLVMTFLIMLWFWGDKKFNGDKNE